MITVSKIITYPLKSAQGIELPKTGFDAEGMINDRRLMAVDEDGMFLTARRDPQLLLISCKQTPAGWTLSHPKTANPLTITTDSTQNLTGQVWNDQIAALDAGDEAAEWISQALGKTARVALWKPQARTSSKYQLETSFADEAPILIASEASMQQGCEWGGIDYDYRRFRPNIIISGVAAFEEESWTRIQIGTATFEMLDTCSRCVLTTLQPDTGERHSDLQPMKALIEKHSNDSNEPIMGINAKLISPPETAFISSNDSVTPL